MAGPTDGVTDPPSPTRRKRRISKRTGEPIPEDNVRIFPGGFTHPIAEAGVKSNEVDPRPRQKIRSSGSSKNSFRPGKRWGEIMRRIECGELTWTEVVGNMDDEELARRQLRSKRGGFEGRPPRFVDARFVQECDRELAHRGASTYREVWPQAQKAMIAVLSDPDAKPADRIKAAQFLIERVEGKVPERVLVGTASDNFESVLMGVIAELPEGEGVSRDHRYGAAGAGEDIVDAEVINEGE